MRIKELKDNLVQVYCNGVRVGSLAYTPENRVAFSYDKKWLHEGFSISPFSLPLQEGVFTAPPRPHNGLYGVFADSLPDVWGALLLDRELQTQGCNLQNLDGLKRLAFLDNTSLGALTYIPSAGFKTVSLSDNYDELLNAAHAVLAEKTTAYFDNLFAMGGSTGGARPKVHTVINGESWIVKFPAKFDDLHVGKMEYDISNLARACGIDLSKTKLLSSNICDGFFATRRFDRKDGKRIHMITAAGLLEISHRDFNLSYEVLFQVLAELGIESAGFDQLFRRMVFNVAIGNRDDHAKNFAFLFDETAGWQLSPAYDLTQNAGYMGERATTINGKGKNISIKDMLIVAEKAGLNTSLAEKTAREIMKRIEDTGLLVLV